MKNPILLLFALLLLVSCSKHESVRISEDFNPNWKFQLWDDSLAFEPGFDDSAWRILNLPHDWSIEGGFSKENPTGTAGGALPAGTGWYRKSFAIPESDQGKKIFIDFDGVYRNSEVWINGNYLGKRAYGYSSFRYDLSPFLNYGEKANVLAVKVDNSLQPNSRWYTGSGIYRNVRLLKTGQTHLAQYSPFITTPEVSAQKATVKVQASIETGSSEKRSIEIRAEIYDAAKNRVAKSKVNGEIPGSEAPVFSLVMNIDNPQLWSTANPNLYTLRTEVFENGILVDEIENKFGVRTFNFDPEKGFFLNGEHLKLHGVNQHHDLGALGAAVNTRAIERQLEILKGMGCNAIRTAHNPPAPEFLDLCDKMGFLVMEEAFDQWAKKKNKYDYHIDWEDNHKTDLAGMVLRDRNHPSVFLWSIGNEIPEQFDSTGTAITGELVNIIKSIDTTRPVTCGLTEQDPEKNFIYQSGALDVLSFNYKHLEYLDFPKRYPGESMLASENMSAFSTRGHYDMPSDEVRIWPPAYQQPFDGNADLTCSAYDNVHAFWGATHEETWKVVEENDFIAGMFIWSGFDFIGEPIPYEWPARSSYYGIIDLCGFPKDVYYLYKSLWTSDTVLHVFPHWNWEKGNEIDVWAYYNNADEVELFRNGTSLGRKSKDEGKYHVMWRVKYEPGTLKAISYKQGVKVMEEVIHTAGEPAKIELSADRQQISADGKDLAFITVKILDKDGNMVPDAENLVTFEVSGAGFNAGVDNGYQASMESFKADHRRTFNGMCLLIVQSNGNPGEIKVEATSDGLQSEGIVIKTNN